MSRIKLRESIAREAARLLVRGKESEYATARKRAARWLSRRRLASDDLPSNAEIQSQVYALTGLFSEEFQTETLRGLRATALELMNLLRDFEPRLSGCAVDGPTTVGSEVVLQVAADAAEPVSATLATAGIRGRLTREEENGEGEAERLRFTWRFPCEVTVLAGGERPAGLDADQVRRLIEEDEARFVSEYEEPESEADATDEHEYHPDVFALLQMLLDRLESVRLDPVRHPEGDALYHSLQVFELGRQARPWDEEFLMACLLHDVGLGLDRRRPVPAALDVLGDLLTERTCFLIERRPDATDYLKTGRVSRSLRKSEHFDDLLLLARCDLDGRIAGADVCTVDEALEYIEGLSTAWDDV